MSTGSDLKIIIWDIGTGEILKEIMFPDLIFSCSFNWNGSQIVTICKDKKIRVHDVRSGEVIHEGPAHEGPKPQRCVFLKNGLIFTTGFSKRSERQYALRNVVSTLFNILFIFVLLFSDDVFLKFFFFH